MLRQMFSTLMLLEKADGIRDNNISINLFVRPIKQVCKLQFLCEGSIRSVMAKKMSVQVF